MKKFILIIILLISNTIISQNVIPIENYYSSNNMYIDNVYFKDVNNIFNKFVGTWEYNQNGHYFKVVINKLVKVRLYKDMKTVRFTDKLVCSYIYKFNGVEIYNTTIPIGQDINSARYYIEGHTVENNNSLDLFYNEPSSTSCDRTKNAKVNITYLLIRGSLTAKLQWDRVNSRESQGIGCATDDYDTSDFKIPSNITLTKIN